MSSPSRRSSQARFLIAAALLLALLPLSYFLFLARKDAAPLPLPEVAAAPFVPKPGAVLSEVSGDVSIRSGNSDWRAAQPGETLLPSDALRTGEGATAVLRADAWQVRLEPGTSVSVEELRSSISKLMLQSGMATASVDGGSAHQFELAAANSDALARTQGATFSMSSDGKGLVAVGSHQGEVEFSAQGKSVAVRAGTQSVVKPGLAPSEPVSIPSSLLLKVSLPGQTLRTRELLVRGDAVPGTYLEVMGRSAVADAQGKFQAPISLREGQNLVRIRAKGVGGRRAEQTAPVQVDTTAPSMQVDVRWK